MPADVVVLVATAVLAAVAVVAATVTVLAARRVARGAVPAAPTLTQPVRDEPLPAHEVVLLGPAEPRAGLAPERRADADVTRPGVLQPRVVEGRVVVPPTQDQVVAATLGRPQVRLAVVAEGLAHALRPESRDRIGALMRREYRGRRRERLRAGRRAARAAHASPTPTAPADRWLGER
jgi:hypothetical protein